MTTPFPLGRQVLHDDRNKLYRARLLAPAVPIHSVRHRKYGPWFNQDVGSCVGHTMAELLNTKPNHRNGRIMRHTDAMRFYSEATKIDPWPGTYYWDGTRGWGEDTGTNAEAALAVLKREGLIGEYRWAFGWDEFLANLMEAPIAFGGNWYTGMFNPVRGVVRISGSIAGGHEWLALGRIHKEGLTVGSNHWSRQWGDRGYFYVPDSDMKRLIQEDGDCTRLS